LTGDSTDRESVPSGSAHNLTIKTIADPDNQLTFEEFKHGDRIPDWKRIRDECLDEFHVGVKNILDEICEDGRDRVGFKEPVNAAIDITTWQFHPSPYKPPEEAAFDEELKTWTDSNGTQHTKYLKDEYPEMVSGLKESGERGYKFATLTIVAEDTPIVLAIEPVRDVRGWEDEDAVASKTRGELVDSLLEQAKQHVDINKVFMDRGFDTREVRHAVYQHDEFYILGKRSMSEEDKRNIEEVERDDLIDVRVERGTLTYEGETHPVSFMYVPKTKVSVDLEDDDDDEYVIFTINAHVTPSRAKGLVE